ELQPNPVIWNAITRINSRITEPLLGCDHDLVGVPVEPSTPPTERTVCDVVVASAHEDDVPICLRAHIVCDEGAGKTNIQILAAPLGIVGENEKVWRWDLFRNFRYCGTVVVETHKGVELIVDIIASAHVNGY